MHHAPPRATRDVAFNREPVAAIAAAGLVIGGGFVTRGLGLGRCGGLIVVVVSAGDQPERAECQQREQ